MAEKKVYYRRIGRKEKGVIDIAVTQDKLRPYYSSVLHGLGCLLASPHFTCTLTRFVCHFIRFSLLVHDKVLIDDRWNRLGWGRRVVGGRAGGGRGGISKGQRRCARRPGLFLNALCLVQNLVKLIPVPNLWFSFFPPPSMIILGCSRSKVKARRAPRFVLQIKATSGYVAGAASLAASQETRRKKGT